MEATRTRPTRAQTRARVLDAAAQVFTERGYSDASIEQIAAAAGLTKGAVYSSFSGKDELFSALVADRLDQRLDLVPDADGEQELSELLAAAEDDLAVMFAKQSDWHQLFIEAWARAMRDPDRRAAWAQQRREARTKIADFFTHHTNATDTQPAMSAADIALVSMALSNGLAMEYIANPSSVDTGLFSRVLGQLVTP